MSKKYDTRKNTRAAKCETRNRRMARALKYGTMTNRKTA